MEVDLVSFDGDGTIWDLETAMQEALVRTADLLRSQGVFIEGHHPTASDLHQDREHVELEQSRARSSMERLRWLAFERTLARAGILDRPHRVQQLYDCYMAARLAALRAYEDVAPALTELRRRCRLALVTNGNTRPEHVGLGDMFDCVVSAQDCGLWKPDPGIFRLVTVQLGLWPDRALHVGDHQREDISGAQAAGFAAVWINRERAPRESWCRPDAEISSLAELPIVLDRVRKHERGV